VQKPVATPIAKGLMGRDFRRWRATPSGLCKFPGSMPRLFRDSPLGCSFNPPLRIRVSIAGRIERPEPIRYGTQAVALPISTDAARQGNRGMTTAPLYRRQKSAPGFSMFQRPWLKSDTRRRPPSNSSKRSTGVTFDIAKVETFALVGRIRVRPRRRLPGLVVGAIAANPQAKS